MSFERVCRGLALVIAVAAVADPAWLAGAPARPVVLVMAGDGVAADVVASVREALAGGAEVRAIDAPDVDARVLVASQPPRMWAGGLTFVVRPEVAADRPAVTALEVPVEVPLDAASTVTATIRTPVAPEGDRLDVILLVDDVTHAVRTVPIDRPGDTITMSLTFAPARPGLVPVTLVARAGAADTRATTATTVVSERLPVLIFEARPSWAGTFLRRALEIDPRLDVAVRTVVSRGLGVETGPAPATLSATGLRAFAAVVVTVPEALGAAEAVALRDYLETHEGAVVLVPQDDGGAVLSALTGVGGWRVDRRPSPETITAGTLTWSASEFLWPGSRPPGADALTRCAAGDDRCAVWRVPVGGGRLVVNGALDGWRTRTAAGNDLESFWRGTIGAEAAVTPQALALRLERSLVAPGDLVDVEARALDGVMPRLTLDPSAAPVRVWPVGGRRFAGAFRAPAAPGRYRVTADGVSDQVRREFLVVDPGAAVPPTPEAGAALDVFAAAFGGTVVSSADAGRLGAQIADRLTAADTAAPERPMRSPWWMVPFAGLLGAEWWSRRRRGVR